MNKQFDEIATLHNDLEAKIEQFKELAHIFYLQGNKNLCSEVEDAQNDLENAIAGLKIVLYKMTNVK